MCQQGDVDSRQQTILKLCGMRFYLPEPVRISDQLFISSVCFFLEVSKRS